MNVLLTGNLMFPSKLSQCTGKQCPQEESDAEQRGWERGDREVYLGTLNCCISFWLTR